MKLSIVRLDHSIAKIKVATTSSSNEVDAESLSKKVLDHLSCRLAVDVSDTRRWYHLDKKSASTHTCLRETLIKSIMRYIKETDRWTAFSSLLLKSIAFHRYVDPSMSIDTNDKKLPVVDLPRTRFNRPYLPHLGATKEQEVRENRDSMMNISHQYPYICMIQTQVTDNNSPSQIPPCQMIGCDLVIFEANLNEYNPTIPDFLQLFVGSFTSTEWQAIITSTSSSLPWSDENILKEFYLRWAMKEAYTKALGMGLNVDFDSFEARLIGLDVDCAHVNGVWRPRDSIWESITTETETNQHGQIQHQYSFLGQVIWMKEPNVPRPEGEFWVFTFIPLVENGVVENLIQSGDTTTGCVCLCRGPFHDEVDASDQHDVFIENLTLSDLIQMHGMKATLL